MKTKLDKTSILILGVLAAVTLLTIVSIAVQRRESFFGKAATSNKSRFFSVDEGTTPTPACALQGTVQSDVNCRSLSVERVGGGATYRVGNQVKLSASLDTGNYGIVYYKKPTPVPGIEGSGFEEYCDGDSGSTGLLSCPSNLTLTQPGTYRFTVNSYESNACRLLCPSTDQMRRNKLAVPPHNNCSGYGTPLPPTAVCNTTHWECLGANTCQNNCETTITVGDTPTITPTVTPTLTLTPTLTPTPGQTITIQGRIYLDNDCQLNGRGGVSEDPLGPGAWDMRNNLDWNAWWACGAGGPLTFDVATWGSTTTDRTWGLVNVGNNPNFADVCNTETELERRNTGAINNPIHTEWGPNPAVVGGFSLTIDPREATVTNIAGTDYYVVRAAVAPAGCRKENPTPTPALVFGDWVITETFWANTTAVTLPPAPIPTGPLSDGQYRGLTCNYDWRRSPTPGARLVNGGVVCNYCFGDHLRSTEVLKTCRMIDGQLDESDQYCNPSYYTPSRYAGLLIPVSGASSRNLWIGVNKKTTAAGWARNTSCPPGQRGILSSPASQSPVSQPQQSFFQRLLQSVGF